MRLSMNGSDSGQVPDVIGLNFEEGSLILKRAGYQVDYAYTHQHSGGCCRILRQKTLEKKTVELIISKEYYNDPTTEEKEVKKVGI